MQDLEKELGARLRAVRLTRRLSQREVADAANVSVGALKHLEHGQGASLRTLTRVLAALDLTGWITSLAPPAPAFSPLEELAQQQRQARDATRQVRVRRTGPLLSGLPR